MQPLAGNVHGRVTDTVTGAPVAGADVTVQGRRVQSDIDGRYQLVSLPAGAYDIDVRLDGYQTERRSITLRPGENQAVDLVLAPAGSTLRVRVVDAATGRPIDGASISYVSTVSSAVDDQAGCADYALLVPLKRSREYGVLRKRVTDLRPADAWQEDGVHFFVFELRANDEPVGAPAASPDDSPESPVAVFAMRPEPGTPISAVVVTPRPDDAPDVTPVDVPTAS